MGWTGGVQDSTMQLVKTLVTRLFKVWWTTKQFSNFKYSMFQACKICPVKLILSYTGLFVESKNIGGDIIVLICYINSKE